MTPSSESIICWNGSQNSGKHFTYGFWFIMKDTNGQSDEEVHRARSQGVWRELPRPL